MDGTLRGPADARRLLEGAHAAFIEAQARAGGHTFHARLAGHPLTFSFAGPALIESLTPSLSPLFASDSDWPPDTRPDLTICAWDATSTGIAPPAPPWRAANYLGNTELPDYSDGRILAAFDPHLGMLSLYDAERRLALFWLRDGTNVPITLVGTPFRILLQWWASGIDGQLVHAAAVGTDEAAVLLAGASGAGKSTTALVGVESGLRYLGDDFVLVRPEPMPRVHSLYSSAKLDDATLEHRFPTLQEIVHERRRSAAEKQVLRISDRWPERIVPSLPLHAILLPAVRPQRESRLVPLKPGDALRALLPGIFPFPGQRQEAVGRLARLARRVPAYRIELGRDKEGIARTLHDCVSSAVLQS